MLDPWIIEEIIRREREEKRDERYIELPLNPPAYHDNDPVKPAPAEDKDRGVVTIDI
jgi:hypothetical protein